MSDTADIWNKKYFRKGLETSNGNGSYLGNTREIREFLPGCLQTLKVRTLLDAPCGDLNWIKHVDMDLDSYTGLDVVPEMLVKNREIFPEASFVLFDLLEGDFEKLGCYDMVLCRDFMIHISNDMALKLINNFKKIAKYALLTTYPNVDRNVDLACSEPGRGFRKLNLCAPPFNLSRAILSCKEEARVCAGREMVVFEL